MGWWHSFILSEASAEIGLIIKTNFFRNFFNSILGLCQIRYGFVDTEFIDVINGRFSGELLKQSTEMRLCQVTSGCNIFQPNRLKIMILNIGKGCVNDIFLTQRMRQKCVLMYLPVLGSVVTYTGLVHPVSGAGGRKTWL